MVNFEIDQPESPEQIAAYYDLRWRILRAPWNQPRGSEQDEWESQAEHVTASVESGQLVGVGRLHFNDTAEAQIRYMAIEPDFQRGGIGRAIVERLEQLAIAKGAKRITLNARENVVGFYERLGYQVVGAGPTMFDAVRHLKMEKVLVI